MPESLVVNDVFVSVEGECLLQGRPTLFVRLQGCNIRCKSCDTKNSWALDGEVVTIPELVNRCMDLLMANPAVCKISITGGNPMLQLSEVLSFLKQLRNVYRKIPKFDYSWPIPSSDKKDWDQLVVNLEHPGDYSAEELLASEGCEYSSFEEGLGNSLGITYDMEQLRLIRNPSKSDYLISNVTKDVKLFLFAGAEKKTEAVLAALYRLKHITGQLAPNYILKFMVESTEDVDAVIAGFLAAKFTRFDLEKHSLYLCPINGKEGVDVKAVAEYAVNNLILKYRGFQINTQLHLMLGLK